MSTLTKLLVALLLTTCVISQSETTDAFISANPELLVTINNYFGCGKWDGQTCLECSRGYFFNDKGICCQVSPQCRLFNQAQGICESCYEGYALYNGTCKIVSSADNANPGCLTWDGNHACLQCSARFYFSSQKICTPISDQCYTWDSNGVCTSCYGGYVLDTTGNCVVNPAPFTPSKDSLCQVWSNNACVSCSGRAYFDANGVCQAVSNNCNTWDAKSGACLSCYGGYDLSNGKCSYSSSNTAPTSDGGCGKWDWNHQICLSCSSRWAFNANRVCVPVSDFCKTSNDNGACASCYSGYDLTNGACVLSPSNNARPSDVGCSVWDWNNNLCAKCSKNWFLNSNKICVPVSDQCLSSNENGDCSACYKGYDLINGTCVFSTSNKAMPKDVGCARWDWDNQVCQVCSKNWVFNKNGACIPVSDKCKTSDSDGLCLSCYQGYDLANGICFFSQSNNAVPADSGCGKWDWNSQICIECSSGYTFNSKGVCSVVSDQCKSWSASGLCTTCFKGYDLKNGSCVLSSFNNAKPSDLGCGKWDWDNQVCLQCSNGWTFNADKACVPVSDQCKSWDSNGACTACFKGYDLKNGVCGASSFNHAKPSDLGCAKWDWDNQICLQCSNGWTFNANKVCVAVSDQCKSWDSNGACTTCFKGYDLKSGSCVFSSFNNIKPTDLGCSQWDWDNQRCLKCSSNWVFNSQGVCIQVSNQCQKYNSNGQCTACFKGYDLSANGECLVSSRNAKPADLGCGKWDWDNQVCLQCSNGWAFNANKVCTPVSDQCKSWSSDGLCTACFKGYDLRNGTCVFSSFNNAKPSDSGCSKWDWDNQVCLQCSKGWTFNANKACVPVSDQCKTWDSNGACTACFKGYDLRSGSCVYSSSNTAKPSDLGCSQWDWDNQICLQCSKNWVFSAQGVCVQVSSQCLTSNTNGQCTSCYKGYDLLNGSCVFSSSNSAKPTDAGCAKWDWNNLICLQCSTNWVFNSDKVCVKVDPLCSSYSSSGACTGCFKGYTLANGKCAQSNPLCKAVDANGACLSCFTGYVLYKSSCVPISNLANLYLYYSQCCPEKLASLKKSNP